MPNLDVTDLLDDDDLADDFDVLRRDEAISDHGRPVITVSTFAGQRGVITHSSPDTLQRRDDAQMTSRVAVIITTFRLRASGDGFQPDQVLYDGITWTIKAVSPYTRFGAGFVECIMESMNAADPAPT